MPFRLEGSVCFAKVPPGFEIRYELYDLYPDGSKNMAITVRPIPPEPLCKCGHQYAQHIDPASPFCEACSMCECGEFEA